MCETDIVTSLDGTLQSSEAHRVKGWFSSQAFRDFCRHNEAKIRHKLRGARDAEDQMDILAELQIAFGISSIGRWNPIYEPIVHGQTRSPEFLVRAAGEPDFYIEAKRIRQPALMVELHEVIGIIRATFRNISSCLSVEFSLFESPLLPVPLPRRLKDALPVIISRCHQVIGLADASLSIGETERYTVPGFDPGEFSFEVSKESGGRESFTHCGYPIGVSVPYTQKESFKFSERLIDALGQFHPSAANVLVFMIDSSTHEPLDLTFAVAELSKRARDGDDAFFKKNKGYSAAKFLVQWPRLSAVVLKKSSLPHQANVVWRMADAKVPFSNAVLTHLRLV